jgi:antirestriction protein ArdC
VRGNLASTVLRGRGGGNAAPLPDKELGAFVRKGEKATPIVFYKSIDVEDGADRDDGEDATRTIRIAKGYWGFNADQVDGFTLPEMPKDDLVTRLERAEAFIANTKADIRHGGVRAFYRPSADFIQMPDRVLFRDTPSSTATEGYYAVLCHELGHFSGATQKIRNEIIHNYYICVVLARFFLRIYIRPVIMKTHFPVHPIYDRSCTIFETIKFSCSFLFHSLYSTCFTY